MTQAPHLPRTSSEPKPGYTPNPSTQGQGPTHGEWSKTLAEYLASSWANGWRGLPGGWDESKYGNPNEDDTNGVWSPQTILAFSQYAADYQPGNSTWIDSNMPYVEPQPDEYIEDPATTASRIAAENVDKTLAARYAELGYDYDALDEQIKQNARRNALDRFSQKLDRYAIDAGLYEADQLNQIRQYETDAAMWETAERVAAQNFSTRGSMWQTGAQVGAQNYATETGAYETELGEEGRRMGQAGQLAQALQGMWDERTNQAIGLRADPNDLVAREYATRALQGPEAKGIQGFKDLPEFRDIINKLLEYEAGERPTAPELAPQPKAPTPSARPEAPVLGQNRPEAPVRAQGDPGANVNLPDRPAGVPGSGQPAPNTPPSGGNGGGGGGTPPSSGGGGGPTVDTDVTKGIANHSLSPGRNLRTIPRGGGGISAERFDPRFTVHVRRNGRYVPLEPGMTAMPDEAVWITTPDDFDPTQEPGYQIPQAPPQENEVPTTTTTPNPGATGGGKKPGDQIDYGEDQRNRDVGYVTPAEARRRWEERQRYQAAPIERNPRSGSPDIGDATQRIRDAERWGESIPSPMPTISRGDLPPGVDLDTNRPAPSVTPKDIENKSLRGGGATDRQKRLMQQYQKKSGRDYGYARGTASHNRSGTTSRRKMIVGDPQQDGNPNPELVEVTGKNVKTRVTPLKDAMNQGRGTQRYAHGTKKKGKGKHKGIASYANGTGSPNVTLPSYDDEAYQNLPSLNYLQGGSNRKKYNTLATGMAKGAFGTQAPEAGSINYGRYLDIARDPESEAMLSSIYKSANRNLKSEVARAKHRAPLGQAVNTSLIRTR